MSEEKDPKTRRVEALKQGETRKGMPSGKSWFLGIGINRYVDFPELNNAVRDVETVAELMKEQYDVVEERCILLLNERATRARIIAQLDELKTNLEEGDKLLIMYAGHGHLDKNQRGYWIPHDAERRNTVRYIRNSTIKEDLSDLPAKHVLLLSDSCFSGELIRSAGVQEGAIARWNRYRSRWVVSSGKAGRVVSDGAPGRHSPFTSALLRVLKANQLKDLNAGLFADKLVKEFHERKGNQEPQFGMLDSDEGGQYVFTMRHGIVRQEEGEVGRGGVPENGNWIRYVLIAIGLILTTWLVSLLIATGKGKVAEAKDGKPEEVSVGDSVACEFQLIVSDSAILDHFHANVSRVGERFPDSQTVQDKIAKLKRLLPSITDGQLEWRSEMKGQHNGMVRQLCQGVGEEQDSLEELSWLASNYLSWVMEHLASAKKMDEQIPINPTATKNVRGVLSEAGQPVEGVSVQLSDKEGRLIGKEVTDSAGRFSFSVKEGEAGLTLQYSSADNTTVQVETVAGDSDLSLDYDRRTCVIQLTDLPVDQERDSIPVFIEELGKTHYTDKEGTFLLEYIASTTEPILTFRITCQSGRSVPILRNILEKSITMSMQRECTP